MEARTTGVMSSGSRGRARSVLRNSTVRSRGHPWAGIQAAGLVDIPSTASFPQQVVSTVLSHMECLTFYCVLREYGTTMESSGRKTSRRQNT